MARQRGVPVCRKTMYRGAGCMQQGPCYSKPEEKILNITEGNNSSSQCCKVLRNNNESTEDWMGQLRIKGNECNYKSVIDD